MPPRPQGRRPEPENNGVSTSTLNSSSRALISRF